MNYAAYGMALTDAARGTNFLRRCVETSSQWSKKPRRKAYSTLNAPLFCPRYLEIAFSMPV